MSEDYEITELGASLLCIVGTMFLFHVGYITFSVRLSSPLLSALTVGLPWLGGIVLLGVGVAPIDPRPHGYKIAFFVVAAVLAGNMVSVFSTTEFRFGTDALLFSRQATDLLLTGENPYSHSMYPATYEHDTTITPTLDGGNVSSFSYPAGSFLAFLPQRLAGIGKPPMHLTVLSFAVASVFYLIAITPREIAMMPAIIFSGLGFFADSLGGILDPLWLFPLILSIHAIYSDDWLSGGLWFGLAASMKQQPWIVSPFLLIWAYQEHGRSTALRLVAASIGVFSLLNLPFLIWHPRDYLEGVFTPVLVDLIPQGVGLIVLRTNGLSPMPKSVFIAAVFIVLGGSLIGYTQLSGRFRWVCWIAPAVILFFSWRSLPSYFLWTVPVGYMALLAAADLLPKREFIGTTVVKRLG